MANNNIEKKNMLFKHFEKKTKLSKFSVANSTTTSKNGVVTRAVVGATTHLDMNDRMEQWKKSYQKEQEEKKEFELLVKIQSNFNNDLQHFLELQPNCLKFIYKIFKGKNFDSRLLERINSDIDNLKEKISFPIFFYIILKWATICDWNHKSSTCENIDPPLGEDGKFIICPYLFNIFKRYITNIFPQEHLNYLEYFQFDRFSKEFIIEEFRNKCVVI
jgi:hypothetical protein